MKSSADKIREQLGLDEAERQIPTGSMWPVIRPGQSIRFRRSGEAPRPGEIWVAQRGAIHVVHRVLWVRDDGAVLLKGDYVLGVDGWVERGALFGPVRVIGGEGAWRPANRRRDRALGLAWSAAATAWLGTRRVLSAVKRRLPTRG